MSEISPTLDSLSNWKFIIKDTMLEEWQIPNVKRGAKIFLFVICICYCKFSGFEIILCISSSFNFHFPCHILAACTRRWAECGAVLVLSQWCTSGMRITDYNAKVLCPSCRRRVPLHTGKRWTIVIMDTIKETVSGNRRESLCTWRYTSSWTWFPDFRWLSLCRLETLSTRLRTTLLWSM